MSENFSIIKKIHSTRVRVGIFSGLLIASIFMIIFLGFFKVSYGFTNDEVFPEGGYQLLPQIRDFEQDGNYELILYTVREIRTESMDRSYGQNDGNNIALIRAEDGSILSQYNLSQPNFVIGYIDFFYEQNLSDVIDPLLFVQYAQVDTVETVFTDDDYQHTVRNETGYYETYLLNMSTSALAEDKIIANLTTLIPHRVIKVHHLTFNVDDMYPEIIVESVNFTLEATFEELDLKSRWFDAIKADGDLVWTKNSWVETSPLHSIHNFDPYYETQGFQLNRTHFAFMNLDNGLSTLKIMDGTREWNKSYPITDVIGIIDSFIDFTGDGFVDINMVYRNESQDYWLGIVSGSDGKILNTPAPKNLFARQYEDLKNKRRFGNDASNWFVTFNSTNKMLRIYKQTINVMELLDQFSISDMDTLDDHELHQINYFNYTQGRYITFNYRTIQTSYALSIIDFDTRIQTTYKNMDIHNAVLGDFTTKYDGIHRASYNYYDMEYSYMILGSTRAYYKTNSINEIVYYASYGILTLGTVLVILSKRKMEQLKDQQRSLEAKELDAINNEQVGTEMKKGKKTKDGSEVAFMKRFAIIIFIVMLSAVVMFIYFIFGSNMNSIYDSIETNAIRSAFITIALMFSSLPFISILYNQFATQSAIIYIKIQSFFYKVLMKGRKNYKVVVLKMNYAKEFSSVTILSRSLMPILISLTVGLWIYQAFSSELFLTSEGALNMSFIGDFETYAGIAFILIYIGLMFIIPGGWLLDDCGVVYFDEPVKDHHPGDISKISSWLLNWLKGLFGITAFLNYYMLFNNFSFNIGGVVNDVLGAVFMLIFVIGIMLIASPILYGLLTMLLSNSSMIQDLEYNKRMLFDKMQKQGLDTTAYVLRDVFGQQSTSENNIK